MTERFYYEFNNDSKSNSKNSDSDYIREVLATMYEDQNDHTYCQFPQAYLKYRRVVSQWMMDVANYFNLHPTTTHAAIAYLDRLQPNEKFTRFEWQMMAVCCILLSAKYNECEEHLPPLNRLEEITQQVMTNECVLNYELWSLKRMGWKLNARTPMAFLEAIMSLGRGLPPTKKGTKQEDNSFYSPVFYNKVLSLASNCIYDWRFKQYKASAVACAILYYTRLQCGVTPSWRTELTNICYHDPLLSSSVQEVLELICSTHGSPDGVLFAPLLPVSPKKTATTEEQFTPPRPETDDSDYCSADSSFTSSDASFETARAVASAAVINDSMKALTLKQHLTPMDKGTNTKDHDEFSPISVANIA